MDTKKYVDRFRKTIIDYGIPNDQVVIAPYSNGRASGITMFNGINVADYVSCNDQSAKLVSQQVAKDLHVKYKRGIGF
ncbi:hypothetical protein [Companilactobacillus sp.]|uniref:hypothetical protein n=1 Tax=Companilactobacillus sp. TaxID=2767905 RepID=UPI002631FCEC|nr:hypothetical protein [Companilactobacillus sp.]